MAEIEKINTWRLMAMIAATVTCIYISIVPIGGIDFWLQAKVGEIIVKTHHIPDTLLFPFTEIASEKFNAHEWIACILFYELIEVIGQNNIPFFTAGLALTFFGLAAKLTYFRSGGSISLAMVGGLFAIAAQNYRQNLRPELIAINILALYWIILENYRIYPQKKGIFWSSLIVVVWVNTHGSFILGPMIAFVYLVGEIIHKMGKKTNEKELVNKKIHWYIGLFSANLLACLVNPMGYKIIEFVLNFGGNSQISQMLTEWAPTFTATSLAGFWVCTLIWIIGLLIIVARIERINAIEVGLFAMFSIMAVKAIRFPVYIGLVVAYLVPNIFEGANNNKYKEKTIYIAITSASIIAVILALVYGNMAGVKPYSLGPWKLSDQMVEILKKEELSGNVLTDMEMGSELTYIAYPRLRPSIDCRVDSYGLDYLNYQNMLFQSDRYLNEFVDRYNVKYILIRRMHWERFKNLLAWKESKWKVLLLDNSAVLMIRNSI